MKSIFVDTSAWYALVDADDSDHRAAVAFHTSNKIPLITTNAVFSETLTLIRYREEGEKDRVPWSRQYAAEFE